MKMSSQNTIKNLFFKKNLHPFHLVNTSTWPLLVALMLFNCVISLVHLINYFKPPVFDIIYSLVYDITSVNLFTLNCFIFFLILWRWFNDVIIESTYEGNHTLKVQYGIYSGMILFILSEIMFFFSFFWAFFHNSLSPSIAVGAIWPPAYFQEIDALSLPLLNTILLLMSGVTITYSHQAMLTKNRELSLDGLIWTLIFGFSFLCLQLFEYKYALFSLNDGIYGSVFFILTGFHGLHVIIGCIFLGVSLIRLTCHQFNSNHHVGYEVGIIYWHMVDVVWLFLFIFVYLWGGRFF